MTTSSSSVFCPDCCPPVETGWRVVSFTGVAVNPSATCVTTPALSVSSGCVYGTVQDAVLASVTGSYIVACQNPLVNDKGEEFENPCSSRSLAFPAGPLSVSENGDVATCTIEVEDCPGVDVAVGIDFVVTINLEKC